MVKKICRKFSLKIKRFSTAVNILTIFSPIQQIHSEQFANAKFRYATHETFPELRHWKLINFFNSTCNSKMMKWDEMLNILFYK